MKKDISLQRTVYLGNDINDKKAMDLVGYPNYSFEIPSVCASAFQGDCLRTGPQPRAPAQDPGPPIYMSLLDFILCVYNFGLH